MGHEVFGYYGSGDYYGGTDHMPPKEEAALIDKIGIEENPCNEDIHAMLLGEDSDSEFYRISHIIDNIYLSGIGVGCKIDESHDMLRCEKHRGIIGDGGLLAPVERTGGGREGVATIECDRPAAGGTGSDRRCVSVRDI